jgi:hypothetical protein
MPDKETSPVHGSVTPPNEIQLHFDNLLKESNVTPLDALPTDFDHSVSPPDWVTETLNVPGHRVEPAESGKTFVNSTGLKLHYRSILPTRFCHRTQAALQTA